MVALLALAARIRRIAVVVGIFALVGAAAVLLLRPVQAAIITVNTTSDELNSDGDCSLREAIQAANTDAALDACPAGSGADTIVVPAGTYTLSIAGAGENANATGDLDITASLTITGAGAATTIIDGNHFDRVFHILGGTIQISGLTIQNGFPDPRGGYGAAIYSGGNGGGVFNQHGTLTLTNSTVSGNSAFDGGGIANTPDPVFTGPAAMLTLTNSTVSGNSAGGPSVCGSGGGLFNHGPASLTNVIISGNTAAGCATGGGIATVGGFGSSLALTNVSVTGNSAGGGGGISNSSPATLTNVTVSGNSAGFGGGGITNSGVFPLTLNNSTVSSNTPLGIYDDPTGVTVGGVTLKNTIVADNTANDCSGSRITSAGHNLSSDSTCNLTAPGDLPGVNPLLGLLADNGGPTQTHALLTGSPAIDAGSLDCPPPATDQRGFVRPQGAACDIGAFEFGATPLTPTPTPTATPTATPLPLGGSGAFPELPEDGGGLGGGTVAAVAAAVSALGGLAGAAWYARRAGR